MCLLASLSVCLGFAHNNSQNAEWIRIKHDTGNPHYNASTHSEFRQNPTIRNLCLQAFLQAYGGATSYTFIAAKNVCGKRFIGK